MCVPTITWCCPSAVFDSTQIASFYDLNYWYELAEGRLAEFNHGKSVSWLLAGHKIDLLAGSQQCRVVDPDYVREWGQSRGMKYLETSCFGRDTVETAVQQIVEQVICAMISKACSLIGLVFFLM
jgi:hypothetical protein